VIALPGALLLGAASWSARAAAEDVPADFTTEGRVLEGGRVVATPAPAPLARELSGQRNIGVLAMAGLEGFGLGVRGGTQRVGLEAGGAWLPLLETYAAKPGDVAFRLLGSLQLNGTLYASFYRAGPRTDMGLAGSYHYNTVLRHGVGLAFYLQYDLAQQWAVHVLGGALVFPEAEDGLRATGRFPAGGSISSGLSSVRLGAGLSLAFFP
jgi:hypothetical protein